MNTSLKPRLIYFLEKNNFYAEDIFWCIKSYCGPYDATYVAQIVLEIVGLPSKEDTQKGVTLFLEEQAEKDPKVRRALARTTKDSFGAGHFELLFPIMERVATNNELEFLQSLQEEMGNTNRFSTKGDIRKKQTGDFSYRLNTLIQRIKTQGTLFQSVPA